MKYPLSERIGNPGLLVGREDEFDDFYRWTDGIPDMLSMSRVILARRKSGKTSIVQRIFNRLWSENGPVIPFFISIPEAKTWFPDFAGRYFRTFASHYISFLERDERPVSDILSLSEIREYAVAKSHRLLKKDADLFAQYKDEALHDSLWHLACSASDRYSKHYDRRFLVIIDEFQYISNHIYPDAARQTEPDETMPGTFHDLVESKMAPMLRGLTITKDKSQIPCTGINLTFKVLGRHEIKVTARNLLNGKATQRIIIHSPGKPESSGHYQKATLTKMKILILPMLYQL